MRRTATKDAFGHMDPKPCVGPVTAVMLIATLKARPTLSNTEVLAELLGEHLKKHDIDSQIIRLANHRIESGIETYATKKDDWPKILKQILSADIVIFGTPIWWGNHSSIMQRVIERMDAVNDTLLETGVSPFSNKVGGMIITGAEDGAQNIIGKLANFMMWNALTLPPACSLSYLGFPGDSKAAVMKTFRGDPTNSMAELMAQNLAHAVHMISAHPYPSKKGTIIQNIRSSSVGMKPKK